MDGVGFKVDGAIDRTAMIRFPTNGTIPPAAPLDYEYSKDGGETWVTGTLAAGATALDIDGAQVDFADGIPVNVVAFDPLESTTPANGTMLYVRPTAEYVGDDDDAPPEIDIYGEHNITSTEASGKFPGNVQIRFDSNAQVNTDGELEYSYSSDNGLTWETGKATTSVGSDDIRIIVDGGYVDVEVGGDGTLKAGQQMVVRPNRASDIGFEITGDEFMDVTSSGKDIFGGIYKGKGDSVATAVEGANIFETVSDLIAAAETNNSTGCGAALDELKAASEHLLSKLAGVGGKSNRVSLNISILETKSDAQKSGMSAAEDIDVTALMLKITKQQMSYQAVAQSSSMIMKMSIMDYM